ncbi:MAG: hypothetical protein ACWGOX_05445 [Desulforhopalus sp.]
MRPSIALFGLLFFFCLLAAVLSAVIRQKGLAQEKNFQQVEAVVSLLALSDLALSTEARYTRHPAVSDAVVVGMDHPGAIDHFPSTIFWVPLR